MTKTWIIFDGFLNAHKIVCIYYVTEILAERSVKNSKKKKKTILKVVKSTLRENPLKSHKLYFYTYYM